VIETKASLDALLRRASRMAERMFDKDGEVTCFWIAETAAGDQQTIITPMSFPPEVPTAEAKQVLAQKMRDHFKEHDIVRYANAVEAWTVPEEDRVGPYPGSLADHPRRREIVAINADDGRHCLLTTRDIIRPQTGKPYLAKMSKIKRIEQPKGVLMDLLNDIRSSSELADDEGTVFVTNVAGAPFQILGRRGPSGKLFVGWVFTPGKPVEQAYQECADAMGAKMEIVTGPEAERLIAGVQRRGVKRSETGTEAERLIARMQRKLH
jgi:hypothetical protein